MLENLRTKLQNRRARISACSHQEFLPYSKQFFAFVEQTPALKAVVADLLARNAETAKRTEDQLQGPIRYASGPAFLGETDEEAATTAYVNWHAFADQELPLAFVIDAAGGVQGSLKSYRQWYVEPLFNYLNEVLQDGSLVLARVPNSHLDAMTAVLQSGANQSRRETEEEPTAKPLTAIKPTDGRKVFVVHGRNAEARDALFAFLRAIDLHPIEWEEAIAMADDTTPYIGDVLDHAFAQAQAAVVLLTGDDMTRLGKRFLQPHDPPHERSLAPQARPNVLFEAGMAFGKYPERTVIVALGAFKTFSDIEGRHVVRISNAVKSRQALADRLRNAGCSVLTEGRSDWHNEGDFDAAIHDPDIPDDKEYVPLKLFKREARYESSATYKRKIWIQLRNETDRCLELRHPKWKPIPSGVRANVLSGTMQIKIGGSWCPEKIGVDRLHLPAGELCKLWAEPSEEYQIEELQRICQSGAPLGFLEIRVNDVEVEVAL